MLVPGGNLLAIAFGVIGTQTVEWRRYEGQSTTASGLKVDRWAEPVPLAGSLQPVDSRLVQQLGLDWTKNYAKFYAAAAVGDVQRDRTGDKLTYKGRTFQVLDTTDWFSQDGWTGVMCVEVDRAPLIPDQAVRPARIASTASVLAPIVAAGPAIILPARIPSGAVVRTPAVSYGQTLAPALIGSTALVPNPSVTAAAPGALTIIPSLIASTALVPSPALAAGPVTVSPPAIPSTAAVVAPTVATGSVSVAPSVIPSAAVVRAPTVAAAAPGELTVVPAVIAPTSSVASPAVAGGPVNVTPAVIPSGAVVRAPTVAPSAVTVSPPAITSTASVPSPAVAVAGATYDPDAQAAFNAMTVQPDATRKSLYNDLIVGLKADGVWAKLDRLGLLSAHDAQAARVDIRNPAKSFAATNAPTFTTDRGYTGDASSAFLDFGEPLAFSGANFVLNNAALFYWCNQGSATVGIQGHIGNTGAGRASISARNNAGNNVFQINDSTSSAYAGSGVRTGFRCASRADASNKRIYNNGSPMTSLAVVSTSVSVTNGCALRSTSAYTDDRFAVIGSSADLTDANNAALYNRLNTFLSAIGAA